MNFSERVKIAWAAFRQAGPVTALPPNGRSSDESLQGAISSYLSAFGSVSPVIDFQMLKALKYFYLYNPDVSQYVANIVNLGNPGHSLSVEARTDAAAEQAVNRLNESASRLYPQGCGVDGLLNQYLTSVAWSGAISSEDVVNLAARRVERVALVPVEQIRFRYSKELDIYEPFQQSSTMRAAGGMGLIPLNSETYKYFALSTVENSPYAKPPATAAVEAILEGQEPIMKNLRYIAQKHGVMGLVAVGVAPLRQKPNETDAEYQTRSQSHLTNFAATLDGNFNKGLVVVPKENKLEHTPVTTGASGVYDINRISEEQVMSGLGQQPAWFGRTDSTTETFADVVYYLLTAQVANMQRIVKRRQEATYRLDLRLAGIDVDSVSLQFNKAHSRNAKAEAETDEIRFRDALARVKSGAITPDEAAQDLGYDSWADEALLFAQTGIAPRADAQGNSLTRSTKTKRIRLSFDKHSQKYRHQPETIEIWHGEPQSDDDSGNVVPFVKKKAHLA